MTTPLPDLLGESLGATTVRVGAIALIAFGALTTLAVVIRPFGGVITGSAEIGEMLVIVMASMSLVAATATEMHPRVHMLVDRLNMRLRRRVAAAVSLTAAMFWTLAAFVSGRVTFENAWLDEETELLGLPVVPFRAFWTFALFLIALLLVIRAFAPRSTSSDELAG